MADSCLSPLAQIMADMLLIIVFRQFWFRRIFFGKQALPKNKGAYVDSQNWHRPVCPSGLLSVAGLTGGSDRSMRSLSIIRKFYKFRFVNRISCGVSLPHPININGHGRLRDPTQLNLSKTHLLSFYFILFTLAFPTST